MIYSMVGIAQQVAAQKSKNTLPTDTNRKHQLDSSNVGFPIYEVYPQFKNGPAAWRKYMSENLKIPQEIKEKGQEVNVFTRFLVEKNGRINHITVTGGYIVDKNGRTTVINDPSRLNDSCRIEAIRLIKKSPKWRPGLINGLPAPYINSVVIVFNPLTRPRTFTGQKDFKLLHQNETDTVQTTNKWADPTFGNNPGDWQKYVAENLKAPHGMILNGNIVVVFTVEKDGSLTHIRALRSPNDSCCAKAAVMLLRGSPKWHPAIQKGIVIRAAYTIPIPCYCSVKK